MIRPQLLVPAADFECAEQAVQHGADALYAGIGTFNLRAHAANFTVESFCDLIEMVHSHSRICYLTLNSMPDTFQLAHIEMLISDTRWRIKPDAVIVSDPGVLRTIKHNWPGVPIHLSTQTGTFNLASMRFWSEQGVSRVILPRECRLEQIRQFVDAAVCEIEIFIHGAMCMSIAGRCMASAYIDGRHANQGDCAQPCRYKYQVSPVKVGTSSSDQNPDQWYDVIEEEGQAFLFNSKDLCALPILPDIVKTGVTSLKIEGRNKSSHYIATVTRIYRAAIDGCLTGNQYLIDPDWMRELEALEHRPYTTGFYGTDYHLQEIFQSRLGATTQIIGMVKGMFGSDLAVIDVRHPFVVKEMLAVLPVSSKQKPYTISFDSITDLQGTILDRALTNRLVCVPHGTTLRIGDILRKTA